ncbi:MAG TPA: cytochrome c, partial [Stellaceae bacterium]|nr:cytochrome c [Stellaceae bacterium]
GCHTDKKGGGKPYAGGRLLDTRYGTLVTPNITPGRKTGIGKWRRADFVRAMRWGIAPDDSHYLPAFPFPFYNRLTERDLADLWAYLRGLAPVETPVRTEGTSLALLARSRAAAAVAASRFPGPWRPDPRRGAAWNRGAYLVATVGRCGDCHTPRNWLGAPDQARLLAGTWHGPDGKKAPNLTPDPATGLGKWSEKDIVTLLESGQTPSFDFVGGPMGEIVDDTARLSEPDRRAIAVYLKSLRPVAMRKKD